MKELLLNIIPLMWCIVSGILNGIYLQYKKVKNNDKKFLHFIFITQLIFGLICILLIIKLKFF